MVLVCRCLLSDRGLYPLPPRWFTRLLTLYPPTRCGGLPSHLPLSSIPPRPSSLFLRFPLLAQLNSSQKTSGADLTGVLCPLTSDLRPLTSDLCLLPFPLSYFLFPLSFVLFPCTSSKANSEPIKKAEPKNPAFFHYNKLNNLIRLFFSSCPVCQGI